MVHFSLNWVLSYHATSGSFNPWKQQRRPFDLERRHHRQGEDNKEAGKQFLSTASSQEGHHAMVKAYADSRAGRHELLAVGYWTQANGIHPGLERLFCYIAKSDAFVRILQNTSVLVALVSSLHEPGNGATLSVRQTPHHDLHMVIDLLVATSSTGHTCTGFFIRLVSSLTLFRDTSTAINHVL